MSETPKGPQPRQEGPEPRQVETPETKVEHIPSKEEVLGQLRDIIGTEFKETRTKVDDKGLFLLEVEVAGEKEGHVTEYSYRRDVSPNKKREGENAPKYHSIDIVYYEEGMPAGGTDVAKCVNGVWTRT